MSDSIRLTNIRPWGRSDTSMLIVDGHITQLGAGLAAPNPQTTIIDGSGLLALPGLVDSHAHIDNTLLGQPGHAHSAGPLLIDKITNEREVRRQLRLNPAKQSARIGRQAISRGTTHIRRHVDIDTEAGLEHLEGVLATRAALHRDAHVAKYTLACFDAAACDPDFTSLYFAAAAHLFDWWQQHDARINLR